MPGGGGTIQVRAGNVESRAGDALPLKQGTTCSSRSRTRVRHPAGDLKRIFDPYFTTKNAAVVSVWQTSYSIIKNMTGISRWIRS
jgi:hypothetical protein